MTNKLVEIFDIFAKDNPSPKIELKYTNTFTLLVAVVLSAQSTDKKVNEATEKFLFVYDNPTKMYNLGIDRLKQYIKTIGLYNNKAKNIIALSKKLLENYNSQVPDSLEDLMSLPGVGRKSANVVLNTAFNRGVMPVDTHVYRVARRLQISSSTNLLQIEQDLLNFVPKKYIKKANQWIVLHGRYVCKAIKPLCCECKIRNYCTFYKKGLLNLN